MPPLEPARPENDRARETLGRTGFWIRWSLAIAPWVLIALITFSGGLQAARPRESELPPLLLFVAISLVVSGVLLWIRLLGKLRCWLIRASRGWFALAAISTTGALYTFSEQLLSPLTGMFLLSAVLYFFPDIPALTRALFSGKAAGAPVPGNREGQGDRSIAGQTLQPTYKHVFIAYPHESKKWAVRLQNELQNRSIRTWQDVRELELGASLSPEIIQAIQLSYTFILLVGGDGLTNWQKREKAVALRENERRGLRIITILLPDLKRSFKMPPDLKDFLYGRVSDGLTKKYIDELARTLRRERRRLLPPRRKRRH